MTAGRKDATSRGDEPTLAAGTEVSLASGATAAAGSSASIKADTGLTTVPASTYTILGEHGRGGLGRILRARDERTGRSWRGSTAELDALARCASGWEIQGDRMVWVHRPLRACATR